MLKLKDSEQNRDHFGRHFGSNPKNLHIISQLPEVLHTFYSVRTPLQENTPQAHKIISINILTA